MCRKQKAKTQISNAKLMQNLTGRLVEHRRVHLFRFTLIHASVPSFKLHNPQARLPVCRQKAKKKREKDLPIVIWTSARAREKLPSLVKLFLSFRHSRIQHE
jgi:hypothetical protein